MSSPVLWLEASPSAQREVLQGFCFVLHLGLLLGAGSAISTGAEDNGSAFRCVFTR